MAWVIYSQAASLLKTKKPLKIETERPGSATEREGSVTVPMAVGALSPHFPLQENYLQVKSFQEAQIHNFF